MSEIEQYKWLKNKKSTLLDRYELLDKVIEKEYGFGCAVEIREQQRLVEELIRIYECLTYYKDCEDS